MSMVANTAKVRWTINHGVLTLDDGTTWKLPKRFNKIPDNIRVALANLPFDYFELGNAAADMKLERDGALRQLEALQAELFQYRRADEDLKALDPEKTDKVLEIMVNDMEAALNLLVRISFLLGIQPQGELYENIKRLVEKYGMVMHTQTEYSYENLVAPDVTPALAAAPGQPQLLAGESDEEY